MRVLLLEDEQALNEIAAEQMQRQGHDVISAASVRAAEEIISDPANRIDILVADHRLPDGRGIAFCIGVQARYPRITVGVVSARLNQDDRALLEIHQIPYWSKPVLYSKVMEQLVQSRLAPPPNRPVATAAPTSKTASPPRPAPPPPPVGRTTPPPPPSAPRPADGAPRPHSRTHASSGPDWPSAYDPKQRLNHGNHFADTRAPFSPDEVPSPDSPRTGRTRRIFPWSRG